jgi:uncharacterized membrane protein
MATTDNRSAPDPSTPKPSTPKPSTPGGLINQLPVERLLRESASLGVTIVESGLSRLGHGLGRVTEAPKAVAHAAKSGGETVAHAAKSGGETVAHAAKSGGGTVVHAAKAGGDSIKHVGEQATGKLGNKSHTPQKPIKVTNIVEEIDVPVPRKVAYDQWTQFEDFPSFMKKVENVEQVSDEHVTWQAKVLWSKRTWDAEIIEQIPDERIVWRSSGDKGHVDGAVTFHELTPDLTRITLVLEYHPAGLFEKTGNLWHAQGRRARLELKHFRRHVSTHTLLESERSQLEGWRGEIHEGHAQPPKKTTSRSTPARSSAKKPRTSTTKSTSSTTKSRGTASGSSTGKQSRKQSGSAGSPRKRAASTSTS